MGIDILSGLATAPVKELGEAAAGIIEKFVHDPKERAEANKLVVDAQANSERNAYQYLTAATQSMRDMWVADSQSESALTRMWRPIAMLTFVALVVTVAITELFAPTVAFPDTHWEGLMWLLGAGLTGTVGARTVEKVTKTMRETQTEMPDLAAPATAKEGRKAAKQGARAERRSLKDLKRAARQLRKNGLNPDQIAKVLGRD